MNGRMKEEVWEQTEHGLEEDVEITARKKRGRVEQRGADWRERREKKKKGAECLGDMRDSLAVRHGVMMADGNHSSDSASLSLPPCI